MVNKLTKERIISVSVNLLKDVIPSLESIYLFGSQLTNQTTKLSDVDIAYLTFDIVDNIQKWNIQEKLAKLFDCNVDLIDLNSTSAVMQFQIVSKGECIFVANEQTKNSFEDKVYSLYLDLCELRQPIIDNIQESGSIYG